jgi:hypothetical protein
MQPPEIDIRKLALYDPIRAYGFVLGIPMLPYSLTSTAVFNSFATDQIPVLGDLRGTIAARTWIDNVQYSLSQPNVFQGTSNKTSYDAYLRAHPGVSVFLEVLAGPKYVLMTEPTPLECFAPQFSASPWQGGWLLEKQQTISCQFFLTESPPGTAPNAPPYTVKLTFNGWQFNEPQIERMSREDAANALRKLGFEVPALIARS